MCTIYELITLLTLTPVTVPPNDLAKKQVQNLYTTIIEQLDPRDSVLDFLFERDVIDFDQKSYIREQKQKHQRCRELLDNLFASSHPRPFVIFLDSLKKHHNKLFKKIAKIDRSGISHSGLFNLIQNVLSHCNFMRTTIGNFMTVE